MFKQLKNLFSSKTTGTADAARLPEPTKELIVNAYCTTNSVPALTFPHELNCQRDLADPELHKHLAGFMGYVQSRGSGDMTSTRYHVLRHIQRTRVHLSFSIEEGQLDAVTHWAEQANALLFLQDGHVRSPQGRILVSADEGDAEDGAIVPFPARAWERKARTDAFLEGKGYKLPAHLPPVLSEEELGLRSPQEVAGRALALLLVAVRGESVVTGEPISIAELEQKFTMARQHLSPREQAFLDATAPDVSDATQFCWRYECLFLLQWALGWADALPYPDAICDVPATARRMMVADEAALLQSASLRPAHEILDALDLHYRLHWLVRQAQVKNTPVPAGLDGGVILERHYALNWLVRFEGKDWDEVDTPT